MFAQIAHDSLNNKTMDKYEEIRITFIGTFYKETGPAQYYNKNKTRSRLITGFKVDRDLSESIKVKNIEFEPNAIYQLESNFDFNFIPGEKYNIVIQPDKSKETYITNEGIKFDYNNHLINRSEIISIQLDSLGSEAENNTELTKEGFETIVKFILDQGQTNTYRQMYSDNPFYPIGDFYVYLNPIHPGVLGGTGNHSELKVSDFCEILILDQTSKWKERSIVMKDGEFVYISPYIHMYLKKILETIKNNK
ncbi:hypothetical protein [Flavobacterium sp. I3-2]|uniref:hypothetical protein n=1 Tax=Flavobacterium sp. I3-2 TaxID=2748319 RepID=UPI0015B1D5B3|nr:hypothetical protein [Flavobacterium sp. I3-2]